MENQNKHQQDAQIRVFINEQMSTNNPNLSIQKIKLINDQSNHNNSIFLNHDKFTSINNINKNNNLSSNRINGSIYQSRLKNSKVDPGQFVISYNFDSNNDDVRNRTQNLLIGAALHSPLNKANKLHKIIGKQNNSQNRDNLFACSRLTNNSQSCSKHNNGYNHYKYYPNFNQAFLQQQFNFGDSNSQNNKKQHKIKPGSNDHNFLKPTQSFNHKIYPQYHNISMSNDLNFQKKIIKGNSNFNGHQNSHHNGYHNNIHNDLFDLNQVPQSQIKQSTANENQSNLNSTHYSHSNYRQYSKNNNKGLKSEHGNKDNLSNVIKSKVNQYNKNIDSYKGRSFNNQQDNSNNKFDLSNQKYNNKGINMRNNQIIDNLKIDESTKKNNNQNRINIQENDQNKNIQKSKNKLANQNFKLIPKSYQNRPNQNDNNINSKNRRILKRGGSSKDLVYNDGSKFQFDKLKLQENSHLKHFKENQLKKMHYQKDENDNMNENNLQNDQQQNSEKTVRKNQNGDFYTNECMKNNMKYQDSKPYYSHLKNQPQSMNRNKQQNQLKKKNKSRKVPKQLQYIPNQYQNQNLQNVLGQNSQKQKENNFNQSNIKSIQNNQSEGDFSNIKNQILENQHNKNSKNSKQLTKYCPQRKSPQLNNSLMNKSIGHQKKWKSSKCKQKVLKARFNNQPKELQQLNNNNQNQFKINEHQSPVKKYDEHKKQSKTSDGLKNKKNKQIQKEKISNTDEQDNHYSQNNEFFEGNFVDSEDQLNQTLDFKFFKDQQKKKKLNHPNIRSHNQNNKGGYINKNSDLNIFSSKEQSNQFRIQGRKVNQNQFDNQEIRSPTSSQHRNRKTKNLSPQQQKSRQQDWDNRFHVRKSGQNFIDPQRQKEIDKMIREKRLIHSPYQSSRNSSAHSYKAKNNSKHKSLSPLSKHKPKRKAEAFVDSIINSDRAQTDSSLQYQNLSKQSSQKDQNSSKKLSRKQKDKKEKRSKIITKKQSIEGNKKLATINSVNSVHKAQKVTKEEKLSSKKIQTFRQQNGKGSPKISQKNRTEANERINSDKKVLKENLYAKQKIKNPTSFLKKEEELKKSSNIFEKSQDPLKRVQDKYNTSGQNTIGQDESFWQNIKKLEQIQDQQQRMIIQRQFQKKNRKNSNKNFNVNNQQDNRKYTTVLDHKKDRILSDNSQRNNSSHQTNQKSNKNGSKKDDKQQTLPKLDRQNSNKSIMKNSEANFNNNNNSNFMNKSDSNRLSTLNGSPQKRISPTSQKNQKLNSLQKNQNRKNFEKDSKSSLRMSQNTNRLGKKVQLNPIQTQRYQNNSDSISNNLKMANGDIQNNFYQSDNQIPIAHIDKSLENYNRAPIVSFLYNLPKKYKSQIDKYAPSKQTIFLELSSQQIPQYSPKDSLLKQAIAILCSIDPWIVQRILQPINKIKDQIGVWLFYGKAWKCLIVPYEKSKSERIQSVLQKGLLKLKSQSYFKQQDEQLSLQKIIRIISGLKVIQLKNSKRAYKEVQSNIKRNNIVKAMVTDLSRSEKNLKQKDLRFCDVVKVQTTASGSNVIQIRLKKSFDESLENQLIKNSRISQTNYHQNLMSSQRQLYKQPTHNLIWVKQEKFLEIFKHFLLICNREISYWTYFPIQKKQDYKSVYQIQANMPTSGSISLHYNSNKKTTLIFYKQIQPKVLKFVGKVHEKNCGQNINFDFTIKGSYYLFIECQDSLQECLLSYEGSSEVSFDFCQFVKSQSLKNEDCEYVQMMNIKKNGYGKFNNIKQKFIDFLMKK